MLNKSQEIKSHQTDTIFRNESFNKKYSEINVLTRWYSSVYLLHTSDPSSGINSTISSHSQTRSRQIHAVFLKYTWPVSTVGSLVNQKHVRPVLTASSMTTKRGEPEVVGSQLHHHNTALPVSYFKTCCCTKWEKCLIYSAGD